MNRLVLGVSAAVTLTFHPVFAAGECTGPGTICAEYDAAAYVILARVSQVVPSLDDLPLGPIQPQTVTFDVIEDFKGSASGTAMLAFDPAAADARIFSPGETVLAYIRATSERGIWSAACSRTRQVSLNDAELIALRRLATRTLGGSVEGTLVEPLSPRPPGGPPDVDSGPLRITAQALDAPGMATASMPSPGYFLFGWLSPGSYRLRVESPASVPIVRDIVVGEHARCVTLPPLTIRPR
jgi:hypothetical protein